MVRVSKHISDLVGSAGKPKTDSFLLDSTFFFSGSPLFAQLRQNPGFPELVKSKIQLLEGDLDRDGFGLGEVRG